MLGNFKETQELYVSRFIKNYSSFWLKKYHFSRPSTPTLNILPHYLSSLRVVCQRLTQRYSFAHCSVTLRIICLLTCKWRGRRLSQGTKVAPRCIRLGTVNFVCIFGGKLIS